MSIGGSTPEGLRQETFLHQNRGIWFDNTGGDMENDPVIPNLATMSVPQGEVWDIYAVDYNMTVMESDASTADSHDGIFFAWAIGTDSLPETVDLTGNTQAQPVGGEGPDDVAREDHQLFEENEVLLAKLGHEVAIEDDAANNRYAPSTTTLDWSEFVHLPEPYTVDYRTDLELSIAYSVSYGNADTEDPALDLHASFTFWVDAREAVI